MSDVQTRIGITPVVQGGAGARSELAALWTEFREGKMSVEQFNDEMRNTSGAIYAQRRAVMLMRTEYRNQRTALYEAMRGFRAVARIGKTITNTYMTYTMMQTRVADKTRDVRDTQEALASVQERRIRVVQDLGASNSIAMRLMGEEERLTTRLAEERRGLKQAQDQNIIGYVGIGLQALSVIPTMVSLARHIDLTRLYLGESWSYTGLSGIVTSAAAADVAILGVQTTLGALTAVLATGYALTLTIGGLVELGQAITDIETLQALLEEKVGIIQDPLGAANDLLSDLGDIWDDLTTGPGPDDVGGVIPGPGYVDPDELANQLGFDPDTGEPYPGDYTGDPDIVHVDTGDADVDVTVDVTVTKTGGGFGGGGSGSRVR